MAANLGDADGRQTSPGTISTGFNAPASLTAFRYSCSLSCHAKERKPSVKRNLTEPDLIDKFEMSYGTAVFSEACGLFSVDQRNVHVHDIRASRSCSHQVTQSVEEMV